MEVDPYYLVEIHKNDDPKIPKKLIFTTEATARGAYQHYIDKQTVGIITLTYCVPMGLAQIFPTFDPTKE